MHEFSCYGGSTHDGDYIHLSLNFTLHFFSNRPFFGYETLQFIVIIAVCC